MVDIAKEDCLNASFYMDRGTLDQHLVVQKVVDDESRRTEEKSNSVDSTLLNASYFVKGGRFKVLKQV